jgi:RNA polymerase sigma-70 factor (ECF subfamily)
MFRNTPEGRVSAEESISLAFLVLMESLNPVERAVFLLRDVFDYDYREIAGMVGKSEPNCRQILKRAREAVEERRPRFVPTHEQQRAMTLKFMEAAGAGDMSPLIDLLAEDVIAWSDGGGKVAAAINPVVGRDRVFRFLAGVRRKDPPENVQLVEVNGAPALAYYNGRGRVLNILQLRIREDLIDAVYVVRNPEKLSAM